MELDVNGTIIAKPTADDIVRALDAKSFLQEWHIAPDDGAGGTLDAHAEADGTLILTYGNGVGRRHETVDATVKGSISNSSPATGRWRVIARARRR